MKLLIIEDDGGLMEGIAFSMERDGHQVYCAETLKKAWDLFQHNIFDAVLLDLNLPDGDGIAFCKNLRKKSQVPVIMLTARDLETDEVQGLLSGADDYLTKPFSLAILKARLDTILRRSARANNDVNKECDVLSAGEIQLHPDKIKVYCNNQEVDCSATEYRLLYYLMANRGQVMLKEQILEHVWDNTGSFVDENTLQVTIRRLRRKLEKNPSNPEHIKTVHGMGYIFV